MPSPFNQNMLNKLQQSVDAWSGDLTSTHDSLAREVAQARILLTTIIQILQQQSGIHPRTNPLPQDTAHLENTIATLETQLHEANALYKKDRRATQQLRLDYAVIQSKLQLATAALEAAMEENKTLKNTPLAPVPDPAPQLAEAIETLKHATTMHEQLLQQHNELHQQHQALRDQARDLSQNLDQAQQELRQRTRENEVLTTSLAEFDANLKTHSDAANTAERRTQQLEENQEALDIQIAQFRSKIKDNDTTIEKLSQKINTLLQDKTSAQQKANTIEQSSQHQIDTLSEKNTALQNEIDSLHETLAENQKPPQTSPQPDSETLTPEQTESQPREQDEKRAKAAQWLEKVQQATLALEREVNTLRDSIDTPAPSVDQDTRAAVYALNQTIVEQAEALKEKQNEIESLKTSEAPAPDQPKPADENHIETNPENPDLPKPAAQAHQTETGPPAEIKNP